MSQELASIRMDDGQHSGPRVELQFLNSHTPQERGQQYSPFLTPRLHAESGVCKIELFDSGTSATRRCRLGSCSITGDNCIRTCSVCGIEGTLLSTGPEELYGFPFKSMKSEIGCFDAK